MQKRSWFPNTRLSNGRLLTSCMLAGAVSLFALACGEDAPTNTSKSADTDPQFSATVPFNDAGQCMNDDVLAFEGAQPINCTANDISIATAIVTAVDGQAYTAGEEVQCSGSGTVDLTITGVLLATSSSERGDIGIWIATDGGDAKTGDCNHYNLPTSPSLATGTVNTDGDQCAGMIAPSKQTPATTSVDLGVFTVQCSDITGGFVHIGACLSWTVPGQDGVCSDDRDENGTPNQPSDFRAATIPGTPAKCNCDGFDVPLVLVGSITIAKNAIPDDAQDFAYTATGTDVSGFTLDDDADATLDAVTVFSNLTPGVRVFTEAAVAGWQLTDISCSGATSSTVTKDLPNRKVTIDLQNGEAVSCTFTNTKLGSIKIVKDAVPDDAEDFAFTTTGDDLSAFNLDDDADATLSNEKLFSGLLPGSRTVTEGAESAFDLTGLTCTGVASYTTSLANRKATINLAAGENAVCTFVNTKRATVTVNKRESGALPLTHAWSFEIRTGASTSATGTVIATGSANTTTGVVNFACSPNPNAYCGNVGSIANIIPGTYQFCETGMPAGFSNNITGFTPLGATPEGGDNSTECVNITLAAGGSGVPTGIPDPIDNTPPPGGDARTIGYWKNWASCSGSSGKQYQKAVAKGDYNKTLDGNLPQQIGDLNVNTCAIGVLILNKSDIVSKQKKANDAAYALAAQLLAAKLSVSAGAGTCAAATTAIAGGQALLDAINFTGTGNYLVKASANRTAALGYATTLDAYNNNNLCP